MTIRVGLFIPCYVDQLYPHVGMATVDVLEHFDVEIDFPVDQTCCGQPMANTGCVPEAKQLAERYIQIFGDFDHVVCPSGSCVSMVRNHYGEMLDAADRGHPVLKRTFELCEFLVDILGVQGVEGRYQGKVGLHQSCHGLRELRLGSSSEMVTDHPFSKVRNLLSKIEGLELTELARVDECCGFGGTFAVQEEAVSSSMGRDRISDHERAGSEIIAAVDMSCLMHLDGLIRRNGKKLRVMHIAQLLSESISPA